MGSNRSCLLGIVMPEIVFRKYNIGIIAKGKKTVIIAIKDRIAFFDSKGINAKWLMLKIISTPINGINTGCKMYDSVLNIFFVTQ